MKRFSLLFLLLLCICTNTPISVDTKEDQDISYTFERLILAILASNRKQFDSLCVDESTFKKIIKDTATLSFKTVRDSIPNQVILYDTAWNRDTVTIDSINNPEYCHFDSASMTCKYYVFDTISLPVPTDTSAVFNIKYEDVMTNFADSIFRYTNLLEEITRMGMERYHLIYPSSSNVFKDTTVVASEGFLMEFVNNADTAPFSDVYCPAFVQVDNCWKILCHFDISYYILQKANAYGLYKIAANERFDR